MRPNPCWDSMGHGCQSFAQASSAVPVEVPGECPVPALSPARAFPWLFYALLRAGGHCQSGFGGPGHLARLHPLQALLGNVPEQSLKQRTVSGGDSAPWPVQGAQGKQPGHSSLKCRSSVSLGQAVFPGCAVSLSCPLSLSSVGPGAAAGLGATLRRKS